MCQFRHQCPVNKVGIVGESGSGKSCHNAWPPWGLLPNSARIEAEPLIRMNGEDIKSAAGKPHGGIARR